MIQLRKLRFGRLDHSTPLPLPKTTTVIGEIGSLQETNVEFTFTRKRKQEQTLERSQVSSKLLSRWEADLSS